MRFREHFSHRDLKQINCLGYLGNKGQCDMTGPLSGHRMGSDSENNMFRDKGHFRDCHSGSFCRAPSGG